MNLLNGNIKPIYLKYLAAALILFFKPTRRFASLFMQLSFYKIGGHFFTRISMPKLQSPEIHDILAA